MSSRDRSPTSTTSERRSWRKQVKQRRRAKKALHPVRAQALESVQQPKTYTINHANLSTNFQLPWKHVPFAFIVAQFKVQQDVHRKFTKITKMSASIISSSASSDDPSIPEFGLLGTLSLAPPIENFALSATATSDRHPDKVDLALGAYRGDDSKPYVLQVVRSVEKRLLLDESLNHEYLPVVGLPDFRMAGIRLLLGGDSPAIIQNRVDAVQCIGGTGAIRMGLDFLKSRLHCETLYISQPAWSNYAGIARSLGYFAVQEYRYWNSERYCLDIDGMLEDLRAAPIRSVVMLQMCGHNPSATDPTLSQWAAIAEVCKERSLFVFFDATYQGLVSGDFDTDALPLRYFVKERFELFAAQSFAKNFGLYDERVGQLLFVVNQTNSLAKIRSQMAIIARETWSNPCALGARIVSTILNNTARTNDWKKEVRLMSERIKLMRTRLYHKLKALGTPGRWDHVFNQTGFFCFSGLKPYHVQYLLDKYHIYIMSSGRINVCGLTTLNVDYVAEAIYDAVVNAHDVSNGHARITAAL